MHLDKFLAIRINIGVLPSMEEELRSIPFIGKGYPSP